MRKLGRHSINVFLAIDPGSAGAAIVVMSYQKNTGPLFTELLVRKNNDTWLDGCNQMFDLILEVIEKCSLEGLIVDNIYCEYPAYFEKGRGAMAASQGDLVKLACSVGAIIGCCRSVLVPFNLVEVMKWKGTLTKEATKARIIARLEGIDLSHIRSHEWDAIGIGLYVRGEFSPIKMKDNYLEELV